MNCPIDEQTADGDLVGQCHFHLEDGVTCPRHGDVALEVERLTETGHTTPENMMRRRKGMPMLGEKK